MTNSGMRHAMLMSSGDYEAAVLATLHATLIHYKAGASRWKPYKL